MPEGRTEFGESYRAVEMVDEHKAKTIPVEMVRRYPDGREGVTHTITEQVAHEYTTLEEAVAKAVDLHRAGVMVQIDHMPDGRGGHQGGYITLVAPRVFRSLAAALTRKGERDAS